MLKWPVLHLHTILMLYSECRQIRNQDQSLTLICTSILQDPENAWRKIFFLMSGINVTCLTFYNIFAKGEIQDWAKETRNTRLWRWDIARLNSETKAAGKRAAAAELPDGELGLGEGKHAKSEPLSLITAPPSTTQFWGDIRVAIANLRNWVSQKWTVKRNAKEMRTCPQESRIMVRKRGVLRRRN